MRARYRTWPIRSSAFATGRWSARSGSTPGAGTAESLSSRAAEPLSRPVAEPTREKASASSIAEGLLGAFKRLGESHFRTGARDRGPDLDGHPDRPQPHVAIDADAIHEMARLPFGRLRQQHVEVRFGRPRDNVGLAGTAPQHVRDRACQPIAPVAVEV